MAAEHDAELPHHALAEAGAGPASFPEMVALFADKREVLLSAHLTGDVHLVHFEPGRIEFRPGPHAPADLANRMGRLLGEWTGRRWVVTVSNQPGAPTLREQTAAAEARLKQDVAQHPLVAAVLAAFPDATIGAVRELASEAAPAEAAEAEAISGEDE